MVRPIDIADLISKTELVRKLNQTKKASSEMEQRQFTTSLKQKTEEEAGRTTESGKSDLLIITKEKPEKENKKYPKRKKKPPDNQDNQDDSDGEHLDLKA